MDDEKIDEIIDIVVKHITTNVPSHSFGTQVDVELGVDDLKALRDELREFIEEFEEEAYECGYKRCEKDIKGE